MAGEADAMSQFIDTDMLIRFITGDDPVKQAAVARLIGEVERGEQTLYAPDTVIADTVFVLASPRLYRLPRQRVRDDLAYLVALPGFRVRQRGAVLRALDVYAASSLDFGDAMIVAAMERQGATELYSYDHDFDRFPAIQRLEP